MEPFHLGTRCKLIPAFKSKLRLQDWRARFSSAA